MAIRAYKNITPKVPASVYVDEAAVVIGDVELAEDPQERLLDEIFYLLGVARLQIELGIDQSSRSPD